GDSSVGVGGSGTGGMVVTGMGGGSAGAGAGTGGRVNGGSGGMTAGMGGAMVAGTGGVMGPIKVLIWNNARTYGHQSRETAIPLFMARAAADGISYDTTYAHTATTPEGQIDSTSDPSVFTDAKLDPYDVVFFLNTTGDTMNQDGQATTHR